MSELWTFIQIGVRHIVSLEAMDHVLFLVALAAVYRFRQASPLLWVITAFTIGHSVSLALSVTGLLTVPAPLVEFLIPVTIVAAGIENLLLSRAHRGWDRGYRPMLAGVFGLIHGAGFAGYLQAMFVDRVAVPLLGFNVGIELGQVLVLAAIGAALSAVDGMIEQRQGTTGEAAPRLRVVALSVMVIMAGATWALERLPW